jgi:hypothetical protein
MFGHHEVIENRKTAVKRLRTLLLRLVCKIIGAQPSTHLSKHAVTDQARDRDPNINDFREEGLTGEVNKRNIAGQAEKRTHEGALFLIQPQ